MNKKQIETEEKIYKLEIERNQYDRIANTYNEPNGLIAIGYNSIKDTVTFTISESLRKRCANFTKKSKPGASKSVQQKHVNRHWISLMFLSKNINKYEVR